MTTKPLKKGATYDDLRDVPDHYVAEMFDGELYASPRPALPHAHASSVLCAKLNGQFHRLGSGGWVILLEPELHFGNDVLVPDLAGWRRERMPTLPADAYLTLAPDWVCEICRRPPRRSIAARSCSATRAKASPRLAHRAIEANARGLGARVGKVGSPRSARRARQSRACRRSTPSSSSSTRCGSERASLGGRA